MRVFKWSSKFHVDRESSLVPVWFRLPKLPIHLFAKPCLFHIVSCLGNPLFVDAATSSFIRPNVARVCVEVDLLKSLPSRVWVDMGDGDGFCQPLIPESLPKYCGFCYRHRHEEGHCHVKFPEMRVSKGPTLKVPGSAVELDDGGKLIASSKPLVGAGESLDAADAVLPGVEEPPVALEGAVSGMGSDAPLLPATEGAEQITLAQSQQPGLAGAVAPRALERTLSGKLCSDALLLPATEGANAEQIFSAQPQQLGLERTVVTRGELESGLGSAAAPVLTIDLGVLPANPPSSQFRVAELVEEAIASAADNLIHRLADQVIDNSDESSIGADLELGELGGGGLELAGSVEQVRVEVREQQGAMVANLNLSPRKADVRDAVQTRLDALENPEEWHTVVSRRNRRKGDSPPLTFYDHDHD